MKRVLGRVKGGVARTGEGGVVWEWRRNQGQRSCETVIDRVVTDDGPAKGRDTVAEGSAVA